MRRPVDRLVDPGLPHGGRGDRSGRCVHRSSQLAVIRNKVDFAAVRDQAFLFVLSPPFSGSTALYKLLGSSPKASTLFGHKNWAGEGQFLPSLEAIMREAPHTDPREGGYWDPSVEMPWDTIKREWDKHWNTRKPVLVEKSPPNICRARSMQDHFSKFGDVYFVALIRSPYATKQRAELWLDQARYQKENIENLANIIWMTYEEFCADVQGAARRILAFLPALGRLDPSVKSRAGLSKGERSKKIENKNAFTRSLVLRRNETLSEHQELLEFFGYELILPDSPSWETADFQPEPEIRQPITALPGEVFRAWLEPELLEKWWTRVHPREPVGSEFCCDAEMPGTADPVTVTGRYQTLEPGRSLRLTWMAQLLDDMLDEITVDVRFHATGDGHCEIILQLLNVPRTFGRRCTVLWKNRLAALEALFSSATRARN